MALKVVKVTVKGVTPLLMHRFPLAPVEAAEKKSIEEQAEIAAYRAPDGSLYVPGVAVQRTLIGGAAYSKGKGRSSLQRSVAACILVMPEHITLTPQKYEIDTRPCVVPATKGRVLRHRPRFDQWEFSFSLEWDDALLKESEIRRVVDDSGSRVGLLDFRPACKGPFGRFIVTSWKMEN